MKAADFPAEVTAALRRGSAAYGAGDWAGAEAADAEALAIAERLGSEAGAIRATRLLGLCSYRKGDNELSAARLERARRAAESAGWESEALLVCNHLGATYRKLGRLEDADRVFREALARAVGLPLRAERARLLANYGAFFDDLGDERAAAELYARNEELLSLGDDRGRLANAHGLVSRAARMRGDLITAEAKAREERRLGVESREPVREGRGWMHLGQALVAGGRVDEAGEAFAAAEALLAERGGRSAVDIATAYGRFFLDGGRLHEAYAQVGKATAALDALPEAELEHRAKVASLAAEVASAAGLHGEALWHIGEALDAQLRRFEPIRDPRLLRYTTGRRRQLTELARRLLHEAGAVERGADETRRVEELVRRLRAGGPDGERVTGEEAGAEDGLATGEEPGIRETVAAWRKRVRREAGERWGRLLPDVFTNLGDQTRDDLILADVVSQGPVGDLSRSLLLLFGTMERELRRAMGLGRTPGATTSSVTQPRAAPASRLQLLSAGRRAHGLGDLVEALLEPPDAFPPHDARVVLARGGWTTTRAESLRALKASARTLDGVETRPLLKVRNAVAHGNAWGESRLAADAVRRVVTLSADAPLRVVLGG